MPEPKPYPAWIVAQIGAREHYAVARAFQAEGQFERLYTDAWCSHGHGFLRKLPGSIRALASRHHPAVPDHRVTAFTLQFLWRESTRKFGSTGSKNSTDYFLKTGSWFGTKVASQLERQELDPARHRFFAFNTGALEPMRVAKKKGIFSILDQIDPASVEAELVAEEQRKWVGWEPQAGVRPANYTARMQAEWDMASMVLVNSEWSRLALQKQGVPAQKIVVVPLAIESYNTHSRPAPRPGAADPKAPLRVLWLGSVNLRKGIPYLIEAARRLRSTTIEFIVAGPVHISAMAVSSAPDNMKFLGHVSRLHTQDIYASSDVFVLPTISDGFAITQLEAMAHGLPVIATRNCGDVVTDGEDGLLVNAGDPADLVMAIERINQDRALLGNMSNAALIKSQQFTLRAYAQRVEACARSVLAAGNPQGPPNPGAQSFSHPDPMR